MSAGSLGERRGRRHGAVARSRAVGGYETYCPQCGVTLSIWPTSLDAVMAAASHNCWPLPAPATPSSFEWGTWLAANIDDP